VAKPQAYRLDADTYPMFVDVQTRESDLDMQRHVNSLAQGFLFREAWSRLQGRLFDGDGHQGAGRPGSAPPVRRFLVARITFDYTSEVHYPDAVQVGAGVLGLGGSSVTMGLGMFQHGRCAAVCDYTVVHADEHGPAPLPDRVRDRALPYLLAS
jgi:acyl-CoA thioester hydrolase